MDPVFQYVQADRILCDTITLDLECGRSVLVLGSLGSGKYVLGVRVREGLRGDKAAPIVEVNFQREPPLLKESEVRLLVRESAIAAGVQPFETETGMLSSLDGSGRCVYLLLANVDSLGHHLVRQLLEELRERSGRKPDQPGGIVALIAGEYDLRDFVYGPASEVTTFVSSHYVLQGCDFELFDASLRNFFQTLGMRAPGDGTLRTIWTKTGGNIDLAISIVNATIRPQQKRGQPVAEIVLNETLLDEVLAHGAMDGLSDSHILRQALRLIPQERKVWPRLGLLVSGQTPALQPTTEPGALTLSGLAKRAGKLVFASPIMEAAARRMFGNRFFGDLYAQNGSWDEAINYYKALTPEERLRPVNGWDLGPAQNSVRAARSWFDREAFGSSASVRASFAKACHYVLGFPEVSFWQHGNTWRDISPLNGWKLSEPGSVAARGVCLLAEMTEAGSAIALPLSWAGTGFARKLGGEAAGREIIALVGDFRNRTLVSPERSKLTDELFLAFVAAHDQATGRESRSRSRRFREVQSIVVAEILQKLGVEIGDVEEILKIASERFECRDYGEYRRIGFTLVNPAGDKVERVLEPEDLAEVPPKDWFLSEPGSGVHPWVVASAATLYIPNAWEHALTDKPLVASRKIEGFAVVPIKGPGGVAGTIHVERADRIVPSEEEGADFLSFGNTLYSLLEQARRITLMQRSLDQTPEPHLIFDPRHILLYTNKRAASLLNIRDGWRAGEADQEEGDAAKLGPLRQDVAAALMRRRVGHHDARFPDAKGFSGSLSAADIQNRRRQTIGAFVHVEDHTYADSAFKALECVAQAHNFESALQSVLAAAKILKREWARIYLVRSNETDVLVSDRQMGFGPGSESARRFENHEFRFRRSDSSGGHGWMCIDARRPLVFRNTGDKKRILTPYGIEVWGSDRECPYPMSKASGAYWVEVPLLAGEKVLGNISLACDDSLKIEELYFLTVLFRLVSNLLDLHITNQKAGDIREQDARERASRTLLSLISHNLATRTSGFGPLLELYKDLAAVPAVDRAELQELNEVFERGYLEIIGVMRKAKRTFRHKPVTLQPVNVFGLVSRAVADVLAGVTSPVSGETGLIALLDEEEVSSALKEVVQNAVEFSPRESVRVSVGKCLSTGSEVTRIEVSDAGPGVPREFKERIFDDFFTNRPGREPGEGGMGLALVRRVLEAHGGRVYEAGTEGQGARFVLEFPHHSASGSQGNDYAKGFVAGRHLSDTGDAQAALAQEVPVAHDRSRER
jgi:signal transduction histidine kinase